MPLDGATLAAQVGASAGLWTHTPVDWRGDEPPGAAKPAGWPTDAAVAIPPNGSPGSATGALVSISAISVTAITATGGTVNYTLSGAATSWVEYGLTTAYGSTSTTNSGTGAQTKALAGLTTVTVYHYRVAAQVTGQPVTYTPDRTFTTV